MFIERLEEELKKRNLTLNKLSKELNFSQAATSRWKHGSYPSVDVLAEICDYLNVSSDYLLGRDEKSIPNRTDKLAEQEQELLENYRALDERAQEFLFEMAAREAEKIKMQEKSSSLKIS